MKTLPLKLINFMSAGFKLRPIHDQAKSLARGVFLLSQFNVILSFSFFPSAQREFELNENERRRIKSWNFYAFASQIKFQFQTVSCKLLSGGTRRRLLTVVGCHCVFLIRRVFGIHQVEQCKGVRRVQTFLPDTLLSPRLSGRALWSRLEMSAAHAKPVASECFILARKSRQQNLPTIWAEMLNGLSGRIYDGFTH